MLPVQSEIFCQSSPGYRENRVILYFILENHDLSYESWYALSRRHVRARFVIDFLDVIASSRSTPQGESSILRLVHRYAIDGYKNPAPFGWVLLAIAWAAYVARRATFVDASALVILPSKTRWILLLQYLVSKRMPAIFALLTVWASLWRKTLRQDRCESYLLLLVIICILMITMPLVHTVWNVSVHMVLLFYLTAI